MNSTQSNRSRHTSRRQWQQQLLDTAMNAFDDHDGRQTIQGKTTAGPDGNKPTGSSRLTWEQRHQQLIEIAIDIFAQKGFSGTTTREITDSAGISPALLFEHFATKEELYDAIIHHKMQEGQSEFRTTLQEAAQRKNDRAVFKTLAIRILEFYLSDPTYLRLVIYSGLEGHELSTKIIKQEIVPLNQFLTGYISQRIKDDAFRRVKPPLAVRAFFGMVYNHALIQMLFGDPILRISPEQAVDEFVDIFLQGILNIGPVQLQVGVK